MKTREELLQKILKYLKPIPNVSVSEWSERYRIISAGSNPIPGRFKNSRSPYLVDIMDAFTDPRVHRVVFKSASQTGKSEAMNNVIGRFIHIDPCSIMLVCPTLETAQDYSKRRIAPMLRDTPELNQLIYNEKSISRSRDSNQTILSKSFLNGASLILTGANSPAGLASRPIRILLLDEVDRYPVALQEGDPVEIASKRTTTFWNYRIGLFSTPTIKGESRIDREYYQGTQEVWSHECPNCGWYSEIEYENLEIDMEEREDEEGHKSTYIKEVRWTCPSCGYGYSETEMKKSRQKYLCKNPDAISNGIRSFYVSGFSSPWLNWETIVKEYIESQGNEEVEQVIVNTRFGKSYEKQKVDAQLEDLGNRLERYDGEVPTGVLILTAAVDVQDNRLEYEVCGWGYGEESWGIKRGIIPGSPTQIDTWNHLDIVLDKEYRYADGRRIWILRTFIDSGGHCTSEVYKYCRLNIKKRRFAIKGKGGVGVPLILHTRAMSDNTLLTVLGVNEGKTQVYNRLQVREVGTQYMHFPEEDGFERGYDDEYFRQLTSERIVNHVVGGKVIGVYEPWSKHTRNESLDLRVYNLAAMKSCEIRDWSRYEPSKAVKSEGKASKRRIISRRMI